MGVKLESDYFYTLHWRGHNYEMSKGIGGSNSGFKKLDFEKATRNNAPLKVKKKTNLKIFTWNDI